MEKIDHRLLNDATYADSFQQYSKGDFVSLIPCVFFRQKAEKAVTMYMHRKM